MLSNDDINQYKVLRKEVDEANLEKQTMKAEIQVLSNQGLERLKKYGFESYADVPKLKEKLEALEEQIKKEQKQMLEYCTYMSEKRAEKAAIFNL